MTSFTNISHVKLVINSPFTSLFCQSEFINAPGTL